MAEILDPPEQLPKDVRPGVPLDQLAGAANWAQRFQPSDASFAQRFRHNRDIREYGEALQAQKAAALKARARENQTAQNFFFRDKQLDLARQEQEQQMKHRHDLFPAELAAKQAQGAATRAMEAARITSERNTAEITRLRAEKTARASEQSRQFEEHMNELESRGVAPDDDEYRIGFEVGRRTFPYADKEIIEGYKTVLPAELTPYQREQVALRREALANSRRTSGPRAISPTQDYGGATGNSAPAPALPSGVIPTLTSKAEFDALPSGAEYLRDGTRYRKP